MNDDLDIDVPRLVLSKALKFATTARYNEGMSTKINGKLIKRLAVNPEDFNAMNALATQRRRDGYSVDFAGAILYAAIAGSDTYPLTVCPMALHVSFILKLPIKVAMLILSDEEGLDQVLTSSYNRNLKPLSDPTVMYNRYLKYIDTDTDTDTDTSSGSN